MCIRDWRSGVCSADLRFLLVGGERTRSRTSRGAKPPPRRVSNTSRASSYRSLSNARQARAPVEPTRHLSAGGTKSRSTSSTSPLKDGRQAGTDTPAPQKNTTTPSSSALLRCSGMSFIELSTPEVVRLPVVRGTVKRYQGGYV